MIQKNTAFIVLILCLFFVTPILFASEETADLILMGGKIITVDEAFSIQNAMAIQGDRIIAIGGEQEVKRFQGATTKVFHLRGKTILPGLIDSHTHPAAACAAEFDHKLPLMESIPDVLDYIRSRIEVVPDGEWVWVSQVFLTRLKEERYPTMEELNAVAPDNPVVFRTGPDASVNSLALQACGIDENWKVDDGGPGYAEKDPKTGKLTGILRGCTRYLKHPSLKKPTIEEHGALLKELFADYNRVGITGVGERDADESEIKLYESLQDQGELMVRSFLSKHVDTIQSMEDIERDIRAVAQSPLYKGTNLLRVGAIKTYMDGGMLTGSAFMREPWGVSEMYNIKDPAYRGTRFIPEEKLIGILAACMKNNVQFNAHSVGDGAVHGIIDGCAALRDQFDIRAKRPVICHSNFMSEDAVLRAAEMGICLDIQPAWLQLDGRTLNHHFGYERLTWFQPLRSIFAAGGMAGGGSDHMQKIGSLRSINFYDPWLGIYTTMTREAKWLDRPLHPEQALSRVEAIRFYTINCAYLHFSEKDRGSLEAGKLADFIVIDRDYMTCPVDEIKDIQVLQTYLGGRLVYEKS